MMEIVKASLARANLFSLVESIKSAEEANDWVSEEEFLKGFDEELEN